MKFITQEDDKKKLEKLDTEDILKLFFLQIRNIWRVDGLYFQGIEKSFGVENAKNIDRDTWKTLAKIEVRDLKKTVEVDKVENMESFMKLLLNTSWALYQTNKGYYVSEDKKEAVFRVVSCKVQEARVKKGLGIFPCKEVRYNYLKSFAEEVNPNIEVNILTCPPDEKPPNYWCEWKFTLKRCK